MKKGSSIKPSKKSRSSSSNTKDNLLPVEARRLVRRVQNFASLHRLWNHGDSFVLGISGGPDSTCLLDIFSYLKGKYEFRITLAHVNYGLRGRDSERDENFVKQLACQYDLPLFILRPKILKKNNLEERLRDIRYQFFEKIRTETTSNSVITAHHEDDQAETFLLHLFRGSGLRGLSAMRPRNARLLRPLLNTPRAAILDYLRIRGISFRTDSTNFSDQFLRNKIRNKLLPLLEREYAKQIRQTLAKTASIISEDFALLEEQTAKQTNDILLNKDSFSRKYFLQFALSERRRFLDAFFKNFTQKPSGTWITETEKMLSLAKNKNQTLTFPGLKILRKGDTVLLIQTH